MADITYTQKATERRNSPGIVAGKGDANNLKTLFVSTVEVAASAAAGTTYKMGRINTSDRLSGLSWIAADDLSTNAVLLDIGLASVDQNVTSDPDALNDGLDCNTAALAATSVIKDIANSGREAWEFVGGVGTLTEDPGGQLDVYVTVTDAAVVAGGTVTVEMFGYTD